MLFIFILQSILTDLNRLLYEDTFASILQYCPNLSYEQINKEGKTLYFQAQVQGLIINSQKIKIFYHSTQERYKFIVNAC